MLLHEVIFVAGSQLVRPRGAGLSFDFLLRDDVCGRDFNSGIFAQLPTEIVDLAQGAGISLVFAAFSPSLSSLLVRLLLFI